ncbi:unnamed protein product [Adineta steineri]|uniref:Lsm14-like N-terminal domain-containing protein n=1 Tax=Adineta steineri TaxID=433720 RepID=A0A819REG4_9BILA|nr:unnamed protein product [Adineta steineri]CAF4050841.1 unnamed protein product [Adineta steineri]
MQLQDEYQRDKNSITHSPYYGCTVRVVSKAKVSYEGILDGISSNKDRLFLKNVRVKGNAINNNSDRANSIEELDILNTVMIDHLTNDMHIYDQVCLNVRDIQELRLIRLPATFHESQAKLRSIDPCLLDIRLSSSDQHERISNESLQSAPIVRRIRGESFGSMGGGTLISSSSNESSSSYGYRNDDSHDELLDEQIKKFTQLSTATTARTNVSSRPVTLLAKKVLPKKIERNISRPSGEENYKPMQINNANNLKIVRLDNHRKSSPIRVTITSKLNPDATPFFAPQQQPQRRMSANQNQFQPHPQNIIPPNQSKTYHHSHQRFIPPRQMALKKRFSNQSLSPSHLQQHNKYKTGSYEHIPQLMQQVSTPPSPMTDELSAPPFRRERLSIPNYTHLRRSPVKLHVTNSLPYQHQNSGDQNQLQIPLSYGEPIGSRRGQRTISGTSSCSSMSTDIGPHSIVQLDSTPNLLISNDGQYDFEKANEEFRRYLELEELVTRRASSACSTGSQHLDDNSHQQLSQSHSYKKEVSFFDRISCTATTGTAVAYTEMDEVEKNLETFGDDALLISTNSNDKEWQL